MTYVKPFGASVMRKLFQVKQVVKESVAAFVIRFRAASLESGVSEDKPKEAFLDALEPQWQLQARAVVVSNADLTSFDLIMTLCKIAGPR